MPKIELIQGDCLEIMDSLISEGIKVDAIITDPPYGTTACKWDSVIPFDEMWPRLKSLRKERTPIVLFGSEPFSSALRMSNIKEYKYDWKWEKAKPSGHLNAKKQPMKLYVDMCVFYSKQCLYIPQGIEKCNRKKIKVTGDRSSVFGKEKDFMTGGFTNYPRNKIVECNLFGNNIHPTQKPVALMEYLIKTYTNEGETVLDFTMGSFTTAIACLNTKRDFIGIELDEKYFQIGKDRLEKHLLMLDYTPEIVYNQV